MGANIISRPTASLTLGSAATGLSCPTPVAVRKEDSQAGRGLKRGD